MATYDWRASGTPEGLLTNEQRTLKASFRGSGGFKELRRDLLKYLEKENGAVAEGATEILNKLGY